MKGKIFSNRNIIIVLAILFALWLLFLDRNNVVSLKKVDRQIEELERERDFFRSRIAADSAIIEGLKDSAYLETFARENYYMKRAGESMYLYK